MQAIYIVLYCQGEEVILRDRLAQSRVAADVDSIVRGVLELGLQVKTLQGREFFIQAEGLSGFQELGS